MSSHEKAPLLSHPRSVDGRPKYTLVIHGGAGTMDKSRSTPELRAQYKAALARALLAGHAVLSAGGEAMDAAVAAVSSMEDCPLFNSGKGAVFNVAGKNELETSIMLSRPPASHPSIPPTRRGAGVTLLTHARNPSKLARALYLSPAEAPHTMFSGAAAESIGAAQGIELVDESYFFTDARWREHRRGLGLPDEPSPQPGDHKGDNSWVPLDQLPTGTVGAVALDERGCIASVTSTGGRTNKLVGRVGDTPIMGAGFWAEEWTVKGWFRKAWRRVRRQSETVAVGVSGTGDGDYFIRLATGSTIGRRMKYLHEPVERAAKVCVEELRRDGGVGGVIALDNAGNVAMPLNCSGMYRGVVREDGVPKTAIFDDDELD
ncbi:asparaginase [Trametes versicolor FP-101664 SS1]|uniref:asparaginase n=1 Tax=Trametes versicolor (strain FP-101664) TaxID=717944 RepID=UPI0004622202|nr:asparaginase [Trametes versicolor FP-101664 SS1]EIW63441.1 asparaginase [Trametes versicolor FP-101664 SS1]